MSRHFDGVGGYDLRFPLDHITTFDYDHTRKLAHLVLYRPGHGAIFIVKNNNDSFTPVYAQGAGGSETRDYDLGDSRDRAFAFNYTHSSRLDHLVLYRPGTGIMWILDNKSGVFSSVYAQGCPGAGIGGYDLLSPADRAFAFDCGSSGRQDHIVLFCPGTGTIWILQNNGGDFSPVYHTGDPGSGIGGYFIESPDDRAFAFDFNGSGMANHLAFFRPGAGTFWILENIQLIFRFVFAEGNPGIEGDPGGGVGGYDLLSSADRAFGIVYTGSGRPNRMVLYRPGTGTFCVLQRDTNNNNSERLA